jgi:hypothetical protein
VNDPLRADADYERRIFIPTPVVRSSAGIFYRFAGFIIQKADAQPASEENPVQSRVLDSYPSELNEQTPFGRLIARRNLATRDVAAERNEPIVGVRAPRKLVLSEFADVAFAVTTMLASIASAVWVLTALIG